MNTIDVLLFSVFREKVGKDKVEILLKKGETVESLYYWLVDRYPEIEFPLDRLRFAVNGCYVENKTVLHHGDEVALVPPVAGG